MRQTDPTVDTRLLVWLAHYPLQRAEDLVLGLARWCSRPTVYRHLALLCQAGFVASVPSSWGGGARLYILSPVGVRWCLDVLGEAAPAALAQPKMLVRLLPRLPVVLVLQTFLNDALQHLARGLTHQGRPPTLVRWNWQWDYAHPFTFREQGFTLRADAAWTFGVRGWQGEAVAQTSWFACLLWYHPLTIARLMTARLDRLLRWRESAERWSHYQAMPPALILASTRRQAEWWHVCAEQAASRLRVDPPAGAICCLEELSPSLSPWHAPWRRLVTQEQIHLRDLLVPLSLDALPQELRPTQPDPLAIPLPALTPVIHQTRPGKPLPPFVAARTLKEVSGERAQLAWISGHLSARHWQVLTLLFAHPLLSRDELAAFLDVRAVSARLLLQPLARWGIVTALATEEGTRWHMSAPGVRLLAAAHQVNVRNLVSPTDEEATEQVQRGLSWLQRHVRHTAGLYRFFAHLAETTDATQGLCWWETGATCERRYQRAERWHNFRPDALAEYRLSTHIFRFWVEWDRGTMNLRDLRAKFASYASYLASREWAREQTPLPWLLCITPESGQERRLTQVARALIVRTYGLRVSTTTTSLLETVGPRGAIWRPVMPLAVQQTDGLTRCVLFAQEPASR